MPDVTAIRYLLANNAALLVVVPANRIAIDEIPQATALPALAVSRVITLRRKNVAGTAVKFCTGRVQITVHANTSTERKSVLDLIRGALPATRGTVDGVNVDSLHHELDGPGMKHSDSGTYIGSVDYMISFTE